MPNSGQSVAAIQMGTREPQRWRLHAVVLFFAIVGLLIVLLVEFYKPIFAWKEVGLAVGGIFMGFMSLSVDELVRARPERRQAEQRHEKERVEDLRQIAELHVQNETLLASLNSVNEIVERNERQNSLLTRSETNNAYYLGYSATILPTNNEALQSNVGFVQRVCDDLGFQFTKEELQAFASTGPEHAEKITEIVLSKGERLPSWLRCFFSLGNKVAWLQAQVRSGYSLRTVLAELEALHTNRFFELDPPYAQVLDELLEILRPYSVQFPDNERAALSQKILEVLAGVPPFYIERSETRRPVQGTEWIWITHDGRMVPAIIVGSRSVMALDANTYELEETNDSKLQTHVNRDNAGWHCSAHSTANEQNPCAEIELVLETTHGGTPVTEARVVLVRSEDVSKPPPGSGTAS